MESDLNPRCRKYGIRALCYHVFETCDPKIDDLKPKLCRDDCFALYDDVCATELLVAKTTAGINQLLPNCSRLPKANHADHKFCSSLQIKGTFPPSAKPAKILLTSKTSSEKFRKHRLVFNAIRAKQLRARRVKLARIFPNLFDFDISENPEFFPELDSTTLISTEIVRLEKSKGQWCNYISIKISSLIPNMISVCLISVFV